MHSTAFRPIDDEALARNPFRVFTSLLRLELIESAELRERAAGILAERDIFTPGARELIELSERQGGLTDEQADRFVAEAWRPSAGTRMPPWTWRPMRRCMPSIG